MKINIVGNKLQIICESEKDLESARDWKNSNMRQYKHNDDIGYVIALDLESVKLIEQKPAYRVYSDPDGDLFVAERNPEGGVCQTFTEGCDWISPDWIEYDPPKKWPTPLVERIAAIDLEAAQWIVDHWDDLLEDKYAQNGMHSRDSDELTFMFKWESSPQNHAYWNNISRQLNL